MLYAFVESSASFEGVLLLQLGKGSTHVGLKFFRLRHQGRIGRSPLAFESQQFLIAQFLRHLNQVSGRGFQEQSFGGIANPNRPSGDFGLPVDFACHQQG